MLREGGMRWGEEREQGLDHAGFRHWFRVMEAFEVGDVISVFGKKVTLPVPLRAH